MIEKPVCPYCGGVMRIVVCDDEGNVVRDPETYLKDPWSGLTYGIQHSLKDVPEGYSCPIAMFDDDNDLIGTQLYDSEEDALRALIPTVPQIKQKPLELVQIFRPVVFIETVLSNDFSKALCYPVFFDPYDQEHAVFPVGAPCEEDTIYYRVFGKDTKYAISKSEYGKSWRCWASQPRFEERTHYGWLNDRYGEEDTANAQSMDSIFV